MLPHSVQRLLATAAISFASIVIHAFLYSGLLAGDIRLRPAIAKTAELIVPFMAVGYNLLALVNCYSFRKNPYVFHLIFSSAFNRHAVYGAIFGSAISWGVKRGIFSNEAGQGTGAQAAGAAEVSHPAKQGLVQTFSVYVDTLFICTATAIMIISTNAFNVANPAGGFLAENIPGIVYGNFTQTAVNSEVPGFGGGFVAVALFFFTYTTVLAYAFYVDSNVGYIYRENSSGWGYRITLTLSRIVICIMTFIGTIMSANMVWNFGSAGVGAMAWFNVIVILLLTKPGIRTLKIMSSRRKWGWTRFLSQSAAAFKGRNCGRRLRQRTIRNNWLR
jgi:AGCS family alanine or glycine:cation symporter